MAGRRGDLCSLATIPENLITDHFVLDWEVDFAEKKIKGSVTLHVNVLQDGIGQLDLDTRDLNVTSVIDEATGQQLDFEHGKTSDCLGTQLKINLPSSSQKGSCVKIKVFYNTAPTALAVQWLSPSQTAGKQHPYLFTQCQPIHARSLMPCQDSPAVKATYEANVTVPSALVALMSAERNGEESCSKPDKKTYLFKQSVPIPSYLLALAVGNLESRKIGPRTLVWSEARDVEQAQFEFSETENMIKTAEDLLGPYEWGQYDLLVLPPSFPYGGMENPCLTFITPTCLAGDKSLANVVAHEISHSWTGNLVTNCSWEHFWLNEGFTVFVERKILGRLDGEQERHFHCIGGWKDLHNAVQHYGETHDYTKLVLNLDGSIDPDDAYSSIPYEKGSTFLMYLESLIGSKDDFEAFLKAYIAKFKRKSICSEDWKTFLYSYFPDKVSVLDKVDWDSWLLGPGMPPVKPDFDTSLSQRCDDLAKRWAQTSEGDLSQFTLSDIEGWSSKQVVEFLALLLLENPLSIAHIEALQSCYPSIPSSKNAEIRFRWMRLCIRAGFEPCIPQAVEFATRWGRMKFTRPIFRDLFNFEPAKAKAMEAFYQNRENMHPITSNMVEADLKKAQSS